MDSLTQIVLGAAVGEAGLGKKIGNKAMVLGAIAGSIPDFDVAAGFFIDTVSALEIHRGFTHSIVFAIVIGLLFAWLLALWDKRATLKQWWWFWFLAFVTHPLLDAHTTWGTQLFWPFRPPFGIQKYICNRPAIHAPLLDIPDPGNASKAGQHQKTAVQQSGADYQQ